MASVSIRGVEKFFGNTPALDGIELSLQDGDFCVLVGPPNAGKTTLLRVIAGLERHDFGAVEIDGVLVSNLRPRERNVAMVFQNDTLLPKMSVHDNIAFGLRARRTPAADAGKRVERFVDLLGVGDLLSLPVSRLPVGARQLVAIGRAVVREAALCLFDDPLVPLDLQLRETMRAEIKRLHGAFPATKLFATRDPVEAMALGDRVAVIRGGRIEQEGAPIDLFERPANRFVAGFFGSPPMNFLPGLLIRLDSGDAVRLKGDDLRVPLPPGRLSKNVPDGTPVILGLRPEHMMRAVRSSPPDGSLRYDAEIEMLQPAGSRTHATFKMGGASVVAELQAHDVSQSGERIPIDVNLKRAALFDAANGKAL